MYNLLKLLCYWDTNISKDDYTSHDNMKIIINEHTYNFFTSYLFLFLNFSYLVSPTLSLYVSSILYLNNTPSPVHRLYF